MAREKIPDDVERFILTRISSVPYLEAMLLLRSEPDRPWDRHRLAQRLYMTETAARDLLLALHCAGILAPDDSHPDAYRYRPASDELRDMVDRLATAYSKHLVDVTNLIHSNTGRPEMPIKQGNTHGQEGL